MLTVLIGLSEVCAYILAYIFVLRELVESPSPLLTGEPISLLLAEISFSVPFMAPPGRSKLI